MVHSLAVAPSVAEKSFGLELRWLEWNLTGRSQSDHSADVVVAVLEAAVDIAAGGIGGAVEADLELDVMGLRLGSPGMKTGLLILAQSQESVSPLLPASGHHYDDQNLYEDNLHQAHIFAFNIQSRSSSPSSDPPGPPWTLLKSFGCHSMPCSALFAVSSRCRSSILVFSSVAAI